MTMFAAIAAQLAHDAICFLLTGGSAPARSTDERIADALEELVSLKRAEAVRRMGKNR